MRETAEELQVDRPQIELLGKLDPNVGAGRSVYPFVGHVDSYEGTYLYEYEGKIIWDLTARILHAFAASFDT